ncbi:hypothetical protein D3C78_1132890 [compost metagenome]
MISFNIIASEIAKKVFNMINTTLYRRVFLVIMKASVVLNKYSKFLSPIQSLPQIPCEKLMFLKAMTIPNMGR